MAASGVLSYRAISGDHKYFAVTRTLQSGGVMLFLFFEGWWGRDTFANWIFVCKSSFYNTGNICQTKRSTARLGPSRPRKQSFCIPFVAFTALLKGALERWKHRRRMWMSLGEIIK